MAGRKSGIDPSKIKTFADWVNYSDRANVRKTTDNRLLVLNPANPSDLESAIEIPHSYGVDFRSALQSHDESLRGQAETKYKSLKEARTAEVAKLLDVYMAAQKAYLSAVHELKALRDDDEKRKKAAFVAELGAVLAEADHNVRQAQYPGRYVKVVSQKNVSRRYLNNASMDDRKIVSDLYALRNEYETVDERIIEGGRA